MILMQGSAAPQTTRAEYSVPNFLSMDHSEPLRNTCVVECHLYQITTIVVSSIIFARGGDDIHILLTESYLT